MENYLEKYVYLYEVILWSIQMIFIAFSSQDFYIVVQDLLKFNTLFQ